MSQCVLDACVLIAFLDARHPHHALAVQAFIDHEALVVSPITLAEVLVHPARTGEEESVRTRLLSIGVVVSGLIPDPAELARLRAATGLKIPDVIVLLTGRLHRLPVITFDERLARFIQ